MLAVKSGRCTEEQARSEIKLRWAYNAVTGKEIGRCPPGYEVKALADQWAKGHGRDS